jgi:hypothetical protein
MARNRRNQLNNLPPQYVTCRVLVGNHSPRSTPEVFVAPGGGYEVVFTCRFCGTEITKERDFHGFVKASRRYKYEPGYLIEEGGALTSSEKADLFLRNVSARKHEPKDDA